MRGKGGGKAVRYGRQDEVLGGGRIGREEPDGKGREEQGGKANQTLENLFGVLMGRPAPNQH